MPLMNAESYKDTSSSQYPTVLAAQKLGLTWEEYNQGQQMAMKVYGVNSVWAVGDIGKCLASFKEIAEAKKQGTPSTQIQYVSWDSETSSSKSLKAAAEAAGWEPITADFWKSNPIRIPKEEAPSVPKVSTPIFCYGCKKPICKIHGECEEDCQFNGKKVTTKSDMIGLGLFLARTQKALGFMRLQGEFGLIIPKPFYIISEEADIADVAGWDSYIRPCPVRPRHGFVESLRLPCTPENVRKVWVAARAADPEAELIVCKAIDAQYNAIITPSMMSVGPGNAGATGGKDSVGFPLMGVLPRELKDTTKLLKAGVDYQINDPYLELVYTENYGYWIYTQLRAGTKVPKAPDYVPEQVRVNKILEASGDLMEWEKQAAEIEKGTVVVHLGGTLISHYGVHCLTNKVPIMTTRMPIMGEILEPIGEKVQYEPESIIKGLALGALIPTNAASTGYTSMQSLLPLMMTTLHNAPAMGNGAGVWVGFAVSIMMRAGMAASHGEARHADQRIRREYSRDAIYFTALKDFFGARNTLGAAQYAFKYNKWDGSFGGKKWAECTDSIIRLDNAARALIKSPNDETRTEIVNALNNAVNQAHNGGWWLNKFITQDYFIDAAEQGLIALTRCLTVIPHVDSFMKSVQEADWKAVADKWAGLGEIEVGRQDGLVGPFNLNSNGEEDNDDEDEDIEEDVSEEPEYDESIGVNPSCCADCKKIYEIKLAAAAKQTAAEAAESDILFSPGPEPPVIPVPAQPAHGIKKHGVYKVNFYPTGVISKAHVRFEPTMNGIIGCHVQCLLEGNYYWSFDYTINKGTITEAIQNALTAGLVLFEGSYSSNAVGYSNMDVLPAGEGWVLYEPATGLSLLLDSSGSITSAAVVPKEAPVEPKKAQEDEEANPLA